MRGLHTILDPTDSTSFSDSLGDPDLLHLRGSQLRFLPWKGRTDRSFILLCRDRSQCHLLHPHMRPYPLGGKDHCAHSWTGHFKDIHRRCVSHHRIYAPLHPLRDRVCRHARSESSYFDLIPVGVCHVHCEPRPRRLFFVTNDKLTTCIQCLSPQMIIVRVLMGRGWTKESAAGTTARFARASGLSHTGFTYGSDRTAINLKSLAKSDPSSTNLQSPTETESPV